MSYCGILLWIGAAVTVLGGCTRYQAPCTVGDPQEIATFPASYQATYQLRRFSEDRVVVVRTEVAYPPPEDLSTGDDGGGAADGGVPDGGALDSGAVDGAGSLFLSSISVDAVTLTSDGTVLSRHQFTTRLSYGVMLAWIGDALATLTTHIDHSVDLKGVNHYAKTLVSTIYDEHGVRAGPIAIPGSACNDCVLIPGVRSGGEEALVVWSQQANNSADWHSAWAAIGSDGTVRAADTLGELLPDETVETDLFVAPRREDAIILRTSSKRVWLADNRFRRLTPPLTVQPGEEWDWDSAYTRIARAWNATPNQAVSDIFTDRVGFDGQSKLAEDRISVGGIVQAVADAPGSMGVVFRGDRRSVFVARASDGVKLGGDVEFDLQDDCADGCRFVASEVLIPIGVRSFLLYRVKSFDTAPSVLQRRTIACRP